MLRTTTGEYVVFEGSFDKGRLPGLDSGRQVAVTGQADWRVSGQFRRVSVVPEMNAEAGEVIEREQRGADEIAPEDMQRAALPGPPRN